MGITIDMTEEPGPPTHVQGAHGHWNSFHEHFNGRFQKDSIKVLVQIKALNRIDTVSWN